MTVQLASMFRDSVEYVDRYIAQARALADKIDVRLVLAEGDSSDDTYYALKSMLTHHDTLLKCDHGGHRFGSVNHPVRWAQIATVMREIIDNLDPRLPILWVESDLIWQPDTMVRLLDDLEEVPAAAPMILADNGKRFYDIWGFRIGGTGFSAGYPHYVPELLNGRFVKIDSCGSCFALSPRAASSMQTWDGRWPFTADGELWLDPTAEVHHP